MTPQELELEKQDKDLAQKENASKRSFWGSVIGGLLRRKPTFVGAGRGNSRYPKGNSPEWYKRYPGLAEVITSLPTYNPGNVGDVILASAFEDSNFGVFHVGWVPVINGSNVDSTTPDVPSTAAFSKPVNQALTGMISKLMEFNSRLVTYPKDQIGRYWLAILEGISALKLLGTSLNLCTMENGNYPGLKYQLVAALIGPNGADELINKPQNYRPIYEKWSKAFNQTFVIPKDMAIIARRELLSGCLILDRDTSRAQAAVFAPDILGLPQSDDTITYQNTYSIFATAADVEQYFQDLFRILTTGASWITLASEMRHAIKPDDRYHVAEDYHEIDVTFITEGDMMSQFHNLETLPLIFCTDYQGVFKERFFELNLGTFTISGDAAGNILQGGSWSHGAFNGTSNCPYFTTSDIVNVMNDLTLNTKLSTLVANAVSRPVSLSTNLDKNQRDMLNFYRDVNSDLILVGTRLKSKIIADAYANASGTLIGAKAATCGTEMVTYIRPVRRTSASAQLDDTVYGARISTNNIIVSKQANVNMGVYDLTAYRYKLSLASRLKWFPYISTYVFGYMGGDSPMFSSYHLNGELDFYFPLNITNRIQLDVACILSEWYVESAVFEKGFNTRKE